MSILAAKSRPCKCGLKYTQNRLPHVSSTELEFYNLPACKYETKILPFISTFYITYFCNQFNQVFVLPTSYATFEGNDFYQNSPKIKSVLQKIHNFPAAGRSAPDLEWLQAAAPQSDP